METRSEIIKEAELIDWSACKKLASAILCGIIEELAYTENKWGHNKEEMIEKFLNNTGVEVLCDIMSDSSLEFTPSGIINGTKDRICTKPPSPTTTTTTKFIKRSKNDNNR